MKFVYSNNYGSETTFSDPLCMIKQFNVVHLGSTFDLVI